MSKDLAVVLASGGLDSAVTIAIARERFDLALLHVNYGQRTESREERAFRELAAHYSVQETLIVNAEHFAQIGGSSLTDKSKKVAEADLENQLVPSSYVPFRNANLLATATSWAEIIGATKLFVGAVEEDSSGYPDCRREFYDAFERVIAVGTKPSTRIAIETPIIHLQKHQIVKKGQELGVPFHLTWSCYQSKDVACGICDSCGFRLRGFQRAGVEDPIPYVTRPDYLESQESH